MKSLLSFVKSAFGVEDAEIDRSSPFMDQGMVVYPAEAEVVYHTRQAHGYEGGEEEIRKTKAGRWIWLTTNGRYLVSETFVRNYLQCCPEVFEKHFGKVIA